MRTRALLVAPAPVPTLVLSVCICDSGDPRAPKTKRRHRRNGPPAVCEPVRVRWRVMRSVMAIWHAACGNAGRISRAEGCCAAGDQAAGPISRRVIRLGVAELRCDTRGRPPRRQHSPSPRPRRFPEP